MAKFGPMVESCSTLPSLFVFCIFAKVSNWYFAVLLILPFYPNVVPARESHSGVASLSSSQTSYHSFPCKHENSFIPLLLLSPKSHKLFGDPGLGKVISHSDGHSILRMYYCCGSIWVNKKSRLHRASEIGGSVALASK